MTGQAGVILLLALLAASSAPAMEAPEAGEPLALVIEEGSVARQQVVALGRDLLVAGDARSDVAAIDGSIRVTGRVAGDVIVFGGDAVLASSARVEQDVYVVGGQLQAAAGSHIGGRAVSYSTLSAAWMTLLEGPDLGRSALSATVISSKLALLAAWLAWTLVVLSASGREALNTSEALSREPVRSFFVGLTGVLALLLSGVFLIAFASAVVGVPLRLLVAIAAIVLKLWGMVAVFHGLGLWLARRAGRRISPLNAAMLGLLVLGVAKLVPWVGPVVWTVATFLAVGAALTTKLGRLEPWIQPAPDGPVPSYSASP